MDGIISRLQTK